VFVGICGLALAVTGLRTAGTDWTLVLVAAGLAVTLVVVGLASPWRRLDYVIALSLPFAIDAVIGLLRQAQGGTSSGYAPLAVLPVVWVGLARGRKAVAAISLSTALLFAVPLVIVGAPHYPENGWRSVVLWAIVAVVIGFGAHRVVEVQRRTATVADARAADLDRLIQIQAAISTAHPDAPDLMRMVSEAALALAESDGACIALPEGDELVCSGAAGVAVPYLGRRLPAADSIVGECLRSRQLLVCGDSEHDPRVRRETCRRVGARSLIVVPLVHGDDVKGVLLVWSANPHDFRGFELQLLSLLANTGGAELVRAELIARLTTQAVTDELTGLANRRAWHDHLDEAVARSRRTGQRLSVLILDLDSFKQVNDEHGHAAGDRLLKTVAGRWLSALRDTDLLGRIGGDEFAVVLEDADEAAARDVADRLDRVLAGSAAASTGLAVWDGHEETVALLARADADMYECKTLRAATQDPARTP
jgi:diguanylate cyclase (GGDEF)-like protein